MPELITEQKKDVQIISHAELSSQMHQGLLLCSHYNTTCHLAPLVLREKEYKGPTRKSWPIHQIPEGDAGCLLMDVVAFESRVESFGYTS